MKGNFEFPSFFSVLHFLLFSDFRLFFFIFHLFYFPFFPRPKKSFKKFQQVHSKVKSSFVHYRCTLNHRVVDSQMDSTLPRAMCCKRMVLECFSLHLTTFLPSLMNKYFCTTWTPCFSKRRRILRWTFELLPQSTWEGPVGLHVEKKTFTFVSSLCQNWRARRRNIHYGVMIIWGWNS